MKVASPGIFSLILALFNASAFGAIAPLPEGNAGYAKFDTTFDITGSCHNGGGISAHYFNGYNSTPGVPADGYNKYLIEFECWRGDSQTANPGQYNVYVYHPGQRSNYGDHFFPNGEVMPNTSLAYDFGPGFISRKNMVPELGRWYCHEVMLKANTVGSRKIPRS